MFAVTEVDKEQNSRHGDYDYIGDIIFLGGICEVSESQTSEHPGTARHPHEDADGDQLHRDIVHHQGKKRFVCAPFRLENRGYDSPRHTECDAERKHKKMRIKLFNAPPKY